MNKLKFFIVAMFLSLATQTALAYYDFEVDGIYYEIIDNKVGTCQVTSKYSNSPSYSGIIVIPSFVEYDGVTYTVTSIETSAFKNCENLSSITIPNSVESIGRYAFYGCTSLSCISIPNSVLWIEESVFENCSNLSSITIPNSVESINRCAFKGCASLSNIEIPNSVWWIQESAFENCSSLSSITIPNSVGMIDCYAFKNCTCLSNVAIPESVTIIDSGAFEGCTSLPVVDNIRYADTYVLEAVDKTLSSYVLKDNTRFIGSGAFQNCTNLSNIKIPNSVIDIGSNAFSNCSSLSSITLPDSVKYISSGTFENCISLSSVTIPNSVTSIGNQAFYFCINLSSVTIPNSVEGIGLYAFSLCIGLTDITLPESLTIVNNYAFSGCSGLTNITIPNTLTNIEAYAFSDCTSLSSVTIPNSVQKIGSSAFSGCTNLTNVTIGNGVNRIDADAFANCPALSQLDLYVVDGDAIQKTSNIVSKKTNKPTLRVLEFATNYENNYSWTQEFNIVKSLVLEIECRLKELLEKTEAKLTEAKLTEVGNSGEKIVDGQKLITSVNQLSSNATDPYEGSIASLIDDDLSTYWHSNWHDEVTEPHYLQVNLPASYKYLQMYYVNRNGSSYTGSPTNFRIDFCDTENGKYKYGTTITGVQNSWVPIEQRFDIEFPIEAQYLRIYAPSTTYNKDFWHAAEINFFALRRSLFDYTGKCGIEFETAIQAARATLSNHTVSEETIDNLSKAYEAFLSVCDVCIELTLNDKEAYSNSYDIISQKVTYKRTFTRDAWQALYLPFKVFYDEWSEYGQVAELNAVHQYEDNDGKTSIIVEVRKLKEGDDVQPNTPYLFKVKNEWLNMETLWGGKDREVKAATNGQVWCASSYDRFTITGVYEQTSFEGKYAIANGEFVLGGPTAYVDPYRIILSVEKEDHGYGEPNNESSVSKMRPSHISIMVKDEETGIESIETATSKDTTVHDLQGRRISKLNKGGMYIIGGKKVVY